MELTSVKELYRNRDSYTDKKVTVGGWVRGNRDSKSFGFLVVNDGTFFETLQVVYDAEKINNFDEIAKLNIGAAVIVTGTIVATPNAKQPFDDGVCGYRVKQDSRSVSGLLHSCS